MRVKFYIEHCPVTEFYNPGLSDTRGVHQLERSSSVLQDSFLGQTVPEFDQLQSKNVTALVGKTAFLTCVVRNLKPTQRVSEM